MKVVILAGGKGTRIGHRTETIPKPMLEIGGRPILCHIMDIYSKQGFNDFIICLGYLGNYIKHWFEHYWLFTERNLKLTRYVTPHCPPYDVQYHKRMPYPWNTLFVDTNEATEKGGRLKLIQPYIPDGKDFMITYGDGLANINIHNVIEYHKKENRILTISAVHPPSRFGDMKFFANGMISDFSEKAQASSGWINGGFMVAKYALFDYLDINCDLEHEIIPKLKEEDEVRAFQHHFEWECVDTERDYQHLNKLWQEDNAFWV